MKHAFWTSTQWLATLVCGVALFVPGQVIGSGGSSGNTIEINMEAPCCSSASTALDNDITIMSYVSDEGYLFDYFIYAASVSEVEYEGTPNKLRAITAHESQVGDPGVYNIQDEDGDGATISETDKEMFADRILNTWNNSNINAYVHRRTNAHFSCIVEFEETIYDNSPLSDAVGELLVFEISGNSWVQIEAIDEFGEVLGSPVVVGNYLKISPENIYTRKYSDDGDPQNGYYEVKAITVDLSDLGVNNARLFRVRSPEHPPGGGDIKACFRVIGIKTSLLPTATMVFD